MSESKTSIQILIEKKRELQKKEIVFSKDFTSSDNLFGSKELFEKERINNAIIINVALEVLGYLEKYELTADEVFQISERLKKIKETYPLEILTRSPI